MCNALLQTGIDDVRARLALLKNDLRNLPQDKTEDLADACHRLLTAVLKSAALRVDDDTATIADSIAVIMKVAQALDPSESGPLLQACDRLSRRLQSQ